MLFQTADRVAELKAQIRQRLATGALPRRAQDQVIYGGYGDGRECDGCGARIRTDEVVYEVDIRLPPWQEQALALHLKCFEIWDTESTDVPIHPRG